MKLYFHPFSGSSRRVLLVAEHLGVSLDRVLVDLNEGAQRATSHLARNPNGRVPVLEDGDLVLWESRAIMQYLAERTPGQTLLPSDAAGRADVTRWLFWCAAHMAPASTILVVEGFVKPRQGKAADPVELARGQKLFAETASILDAHLANKDWAAQDRLTLADFSLASTFALSGPARFPMSDFAHLRRWLGRIQELDAWQRTAPPAPPAPR